MSIILKMALNKKVLDPHVILGLGDIIPEEFLLR